MNIAYAAATGDIAGETTGELTGLIEMVITRIPLYIAAFIVVILSILVAKLVRSMVESKLAENAADDEQKELQTLGGRMSYAGVLTLGITIALKIAGIDLTAIVAAAGFGLGFALKDLIVNFLAGIMLLVGKDFQIGDFIKIGKTLGKVKEIQSRVTILQAIDGTKVIVPNASLFKKEVISFTSNPFRRIEVLVGVDYRNDLENAIRVCMDAVKNTKGIVLEPKPAVVVSEFAESSISLKVRAWVESRSAWIKTKSELVVNIKKNFDKYGITIPWPIHTIAYDKDQEAVEKIMELSEPKKEKAVPDVPKVTVVQPQPQPQTAQVPTQVQAQAQVPVPQEVEAGEQPLRPISEQR